MHNERIKIVTNHLNGKYEISGDGVIGIIDKLFNNGSEYIYINGRNGIEWSHDKDKIMWAPCANGTLTFVGNLKSRCPGFHWTYL